MQTYEQYYKFEFMNVREPLLQPQTAFSARLMSSIGSWYDFHGALVDARAEHGLTQQQLAKRLQISQPAVSVFENSNTLATQIETIISYAAALGMEVEFSLRKTDYPDLPESGVKELL